MFNGRTDERALNESATNAHSRQRQANRLGTPTIPKAGVKHEDARQNRVSERDDKAHHRETEKSFVGPKQIERTHGIRLFPFERHSVFGRERFRKHKEAIERVDETQSRGSPKRQTRIDISEQPTQ